MNNKRQNTSEWFENLRNQIIEEFQSLEIIYSNSKGLVAGEFEQKSWKRDGGGGGVMSIMRGNLFEKVGVNISTVYGEFSDEFRSQIPGAIEDPGFFATGISLVSHMASPLVPALHFNTRYIETTKSWFGGGSDMTPMYPDTIETEKFHAAIKGTCDKHDILYYPRFKEECDKYFYLKHRDEPRGVGGIFFDYLNTENFDKDFEFVRDVGVCVKDIYPNIINDKMHLQWTAEQREHQLVKRGRYVEFNLLYDRGTTFGLKTGGNIDAIMMSMPPEVKWQ